MNSPDLTPASSCRSDSCRSDFVTTRWSLVVAAGGQGGPASADALAELCQAYWYPVYAFVRRRVGDAHEAQDLTQAFFERLLERQLVRAADPGRGRFRAFLLTACQRFLVNEWHRGRTARRGGGAGPLSLDFQAGESRYSVEPADTLTAQRLYERQWAITLLARVLAGLKDEYAGKGKAEHFDRLKPFLSGADGADAYAAAAADLGMSVGAARVAAHRLRGRYRELLRGEIAQTVDSADAVDEEIRNLFTVLGG